MTGAASLGRKKWPWLALCAALLVTGCGPAASSVRTKAADAAAATKDGLSLAGRVTDAAHILSPKEIDSLSTYLANFEARSRHQMVVVTVPSLGGRDVADYTRELANRWGIGRKGVNDGIVVLVAPNERKVRIAVGYGLEKILTNDYCAHVIQAMMPSFKAGRFYDGLILGATGLARVARRV